MQFITGQFGRMPGRLTGELASYRHKVFVERLGWQLEVDGELELDQFDRPDTRYVMARDADGDMIGCARLLPTTQPYLLGELFPQLLGGLPVPSSPHIWELSRFAAVDLKADRGVFSGQFSSPIAVGLLRKAIDCAADNGAHELISVSPLGVERLLRKAGFRSRRIGTPMLAGGQPVFACVISIQ